MRNLDLAIWDLSGKIANYVVVFFIAVVLTRILTPVEFGAFAIVLAVVSLSMMFVDIGFKSSIIQAREISQIQLTTIFFINLFLGIVLLGLFSALAPQIEAFYGIDSLSFYVRVTALLFIFNSLTLVPMGLLQRDMRLRAISVISFASAAISGAAAIALALSGWRIWALIFQHIVSAVTTMSLVYVVTRWRPSFSINFRSISSLWNYSYKLLLANLVGNVSNRLDVFVIGKIFPITLLGHYNRAHSLDAQSRTFFTSTISALAFPFFSKIQDDNERVRTFYLRYLHYVAFFSTAVCGALLIVGDDLILVLYTEKWALAGSLFQYIVASSFVYPINSLMTSVVSARGRSGMILKMSLLKKSVTSLCFIALFSGSVYPFLVSLIFASVFSLGINATFVRKEIGTPLLSQFSIVFRYLVLALAAAAGGHFAGYLATGPYSELVLQGLAYASAFVLLFFAFRFTTIRELFSEIIIPRTRELIAQTFTTKAA